MNVQDEGHADDMNDVEVLQTALLEGIVRGKKAIEDGRVVSHAEAREHMACWVD